MVAPAPAACRPRADGRRLVDLPVLGLQLGQGRPGRGSATFSLQRGGQVGDATGGQATGPEQRVDRAVLHACTLSGRPSAAALTSRPDPGRRPPAAAARSPRCRNSGEPVDTALPRRSATRRCRRRRGRDLRVVGVDARQRADRLRRRRRRPCPRRRPRRCPPGRRRCRCRRRRPAGCFPPRRRSPPRSPCSPRCWRRSAARARHRGCSRRRSCCRWRWRAGPPRRLAEPRAVSPPQPASASAASRRRQGSGAQFMPTCVASSRVSWVSAVPVVGGQLQRRRRRRTARRRPAADRHAARDRAAAARRRRAAPLGPARPARTAIRR